MDNKKKYIFIAFLIPTLLILFSLVSLKYVSKNPKENSKNTISNEVLGAKRDTPKMDEEWAATVQKSLDNRNDTSICNKQREGYYLNVTILDVLEMYRPTEGRATVVCHGDTYLLGSYVQGLFLDGKIFRGLTYSYDQVALFENDQEVNILLTRRKISEFLKNFLLQKYISIDKKTDTFSLKTLPDIEDSHGVVPFFLTQDERTQDLHSKDIQEFQYKVFNDQKKIVYVYKLEKGEEEVWVYDFEKKNTIFQKKIENWSMLYCDTLGNCQMKEGNMKWEGDELILSEEPFACDMPGYYVSDFFDLDYTQRFICHNEKIIYTLDTKILFGQSDDGGSEYPDIREFLQLPDGKNTRIYLVWAVGCDGACSGIERFFINIDKENKVTIKKIETEARLFQKGTPLLKISPDKTKVLYTYTDWDQSDQRKLWQVVAVFDFLQEKNTILRILDSDEFVFTCEMGCSFIPGTLGWKDNKPVITPKKYDDLSEQEKLLLSDYFTTGSPKVLP